MRYTLNRAGVTAVIDGETGRFTLRFGAYDWLFDDSEVTLTDESSGETLTPAMAKTFHAVQGKNALDDNLILEYSSFDGAEGLSLRLIWRLHDTYLDVTAQVEGDRRAPHGRLFFPAALRFGEAEEDSYTLLNKMQGMLIPARHPKRVKHFDSGMMFGRNAYLPFYAWAKGREGILAIFHTPYDAGYEIDHPGGGHTQLRPYFVTSLGYMRGARTMRFMFVKDASVMRFASLYRQYADEQGRAKTLREKEAVNPAIRALYGAPVIHAGLMRNIVPESDQYRPDDPAYNRQVVTFDRRAEQLRALKARGVDRAYLHFDGWGRRGYDNLHPDPFPPSAECGGIEGMRRLADTAKALGYIFGIHDQYRDFYYDAPSYSDQLVVENADHTRFDGGHWDGGRMTLLCSECALDFVKRNYTALSDAGIDVKAAYLDVFGVVDLDECVNPLHQATREQCAQNRRACFEYLNRRGVITSSEEAVETMLPSIALCHHAPFMVDGEPFFTGGDDDHMAPAVPLFSLVYHDCLITPWPGLSGKSAWGMMSKRDRPFSWALLTGSPVYYDIEETDENIALGRVALRLHERVATQKIVDFGFVNGNWRCQYTVFEDGTRVQVDLDTGEYEITEPKADAKEDTP